GNPNLSGSLSQKLAGMGRTDLAAALNTPVSSVQAFALDTPELYMQGFGQPDLSWWTKRFSGFVNENYHVVPTLTLDLGLRVQSEKNPNVAAQINADP